MRIIGSLTKALVAGALVAGTASAQVINYTTQGFFGGPGTLASGVTCTTAAALTASCSGGGFSLIFNGTSGVNLANNTIASLGTFNLTGTGNTTVPSGAIFFTLLVNQTTPSLGQGTFLGSITGTVSTGSTNFSSLIWTPNATTVIGSTNYRVIYDNVGPAANVGLGIPINNTRGIDALVSTTTATPEPGTVTLVVTGLAGLIPMVRRRQKKA